jgi:HSP20 family protein
MSHFPVDPFEIAQREVERLWRDLVYHRLPSSHFAEQPWAPPTDVVVSDASARVIIELAGVPREAVHVRLRERTLEISGRRQPPLKPAGVHYQRAEIYFGDFQRIIELPWVADQRRVYASFHEGMLEIRLQPVASARRTTVTVRSRVT